MKSRICIMAALCAFLLVPALATAQEGALKIAIASPPRILTQLQETKDVMDKMNAERQQLALTEKQKRDNVNALKEARDQLKPGSAQYQERNEAFVKAAIEFDSWGKISQMDQQRKQKEQMVRMFNKIQDAVAELARERGIDLVLTEQKPEIPDNLDQVNADQLRGDINGRNILYFNPKLDISNDVVAWMDKQYKQAAQ